MGFGGCKKIEGYLYLICNLMNVICMKEHENIPSQKKIIQTLMNQFERH